jgi:multiple sugar transport system ATP-binding protein
VAAVSFSGVGKIYPNGTRALGDFNLDVEDGEFMVFVGPSGCGKTTALRMVAGLEEISEGQIRIGDRVINDLDPGSRDIAMVFQNYALYPHMTVRDNMGFGLRMRKVAAAERRRQVDEIAAVLGIEDLLDRKPKHLSGGQRQRVAMGRAIVRNPAAFLMDEPLSNLDARLRVQMRAEISRIQREVNATTIYVTHDQVEAMTMGRRVAVLRKGELQQVDPPQHLYDEPVNLFVASFIGSPEMNLVQGTLLRDADSLAVSIGADVLRIPRETAESRRALASYVSKPVAVGIRPEFTGAGAEGARDVLHARLVVAETLGAETLVHAELAAPPVLSEQVLEVAEDTDASTAAGLRSAAHTERAPFLARFGGSFRGTVDDSITIAIQTNRLYFFDPSTGSAIR